MERSGSPLVPDPPLSRPLDRFPRLALAARLFHAAELRWPAEGDHYAAGEAIQAAVKTFPEHRLALMDDPKLSESFLI